MSRSVLLQANRGYSKDSVISNRCPNVLVYSNEQYKTVHYKTGIQACLNSSKYVVYGVCEQVIQTDPWTANAHLLVVCLHDSLKQSVLNAVSNYLHRGGGRCLCFSPDSAVCDNLLRGLGAGGDVYSGHLTPGVEEPAQISFSSKMSPKFRFSSSGFDLSKAKSEPIKGSISSGVHGESVGQDEDAVSRGAIVGVQGKSVGQGEDPAFSLIICNYDFDDFTKLPNSEVSKWHPTLNLFLERLCMECADTTTPALTPGVILAQSSIDADIVRRQLQLAANSNTGKVNSCLKLVNDTMGCIALHDCTPVSVGCSPTDDQLFNSGDYFQNLTTDNFGKIVIFVEVATSTMDLLDNFYKILPQFPGICAVSLRQTQGKGRSGNVWISPIGCAMFTINIRIALASNLGKHVSLLQQIMSVAIIKSILRRPGYQSLELRYKWPNDIFYRDAIKIGGVLVNSSVYSDCLHASVGCGLNLDNVSPTVCFNSIIKDYNALHSTDLRPLTLEDFLSGVFNTLEEIVTQIEVQGHQYVLDLIHELWIHTNQKVSLYGEEEGRVVSLDDYGYLVVVKSDGSQVTVQPDGNSFDMIQNLISFKILKPATNRS